MKSSILLTLCVGASFFAEALALENTATDGIPFTAAFPIIQKTFSSDSLYLYKKPGGGNDGVWNDDAFSTAYRLLPDEVVEAPVDWRDDCIRVGNTSKIGCFKITQIPGEKTLYVTFRAGAWYKENSSLYVWLNAGSSREYEVEKSKFTSFKVAYPLAAGQVGPFTLSFYNKNMTGSRKSPIFLDDVYIYQESSDEEKFKTAERIILTGNYSIEQVTRLNELIRQNDRVLSVDVGSVSSFPNGVTLTPGNPNCLFYDDLAYLANAENVVRAGVCANLVLKDAQPFGAMYEFIATNVSYDRTFQTGNYRSSVFLPFTVPASNVPGITSLYKSMTYDPQTGIVTYQTGKNIGTNYPCFITTSEPQPFLHLENVKAKVEATSSRILSGSGGFTMAGTYVERTDLASGPGVSIYGFSGGRFVKVGSGCVFPPFRGYVTLPASEGTTQSKELRVAFGNELVGVESVPNPPLSKKVDVYDTNGHLVRKQVTPEQALRGLPRGLYIVGGKKVWNE